ncbi:hypothetical protein B0O99DRAFT_590536 [Bisporella sp. PMI_857]|nr:hypothetical protein B0O99DRAFT_590536 [Bisporella sp. PMI_857]
MSINLCQSIGIGAISLDSLIFNSSDQPFNRQKDDRIIASLVEGYQKSRNGCDRGNPKFYISAVVRGNELMNILEFSSLTLSNLQRSTTDTNYRPTLYTGGSKVLCLFGRHRIEAAKLFLHSQDAWWTIELFLSEPGVAPLSDGEVYRKVRYYKEEEDIVQEWMLTLSNSKRTILQRLLRDPLKKSFDLLLDFPGIWCGLEIGNISRHFALRCPEEVTNYLEHNILEVWNNITLKDTQLRGFVDIGTVRNLENRCPANSVSDRDYIIRAMDGNIIFPGISDPDTRRKIKIAILELKLIIPSLKTFHESLNYFEIGVKIIKNLICTERVKVSLRQYMASPRMWHPPPAPIVEVNDSEFRHITLNPYEEEYSKIAFLHLFVIVLRQFASLSKHSPRKDSKQEVIHGAMDPQQQYWCLKRVQLLGYHSEKIKQSLLDLRGFNLPYTMPHATVPSVGEGPRRRCGRPFVNAYKEIRAKLYIPNMVAAAKELTLEPTVMFVQQDFMRAFFGTTWSKIVLEHSFSIPIAPSILVADQGSPNPMGDQPVRPSALESCNNASEHNFRQPRYHTTSANSSTTSTSQSQSRSSNASTACCGTPSSALIDLTQRLETTFRGDERESRTSLRNVSLDELSHRDEIDAIYDFYNSQNASQGGTEVIQSPINEQASLDHDAVTKSHADRNGRALQSLRSANTESMEIQPQSPRSFLASGRSTSSLGEVSGDLRIIDRYRSFLTPANISPMHTPQTHAEHGATTRLSNGSEFSLDKRSFLGSNDGIDQDRPQRTDSITQSHRSFLDPTIRDSGSIFMMGDEEFQFPQSHRSFLDPTMEKRSLIQDSESIFMMGDEESQLPQSHRSFLDTTKRSSTQSTGSSMQVSLFKASSLIFQTISDCAEQELSSPKCRSFLERASLHRDSEITASETTSILVQEWQSLLGPSPSGEQEREVSPMSGSGLQQPELNSNMEIAYNATQIKEKKKQKAVKNVAFTFHEYNGMTILNRSTQNLELYLQQREGWKGIMTKGRLTKSVKSEHIDHMMRCYRAGESFVLVEPRYVEQLFNNYPKLARHSYASANENFDNRHNKKKKT